MQDAAAQYAMQSAGNIAGAAAAPCIGSGDVLLGVIAMLHKGLGG